MAFQACVRLLGVCAVAGTTCPSQQRQHIFQEDVPAAEANSMLQHASRQLQNQTKEVLNGSRFPNPFEVLGGLTGSTGAGSAPSSVSALAKIFLGQDQDNMEECGNFLNQVLNQVFSNPTQAMSVITNLLSQGSTQSIGCLKMALDYADQAVTPSECRMADGTIDPSCCVHEKRCSDTNPMDGCPTLVFPPSNIFDMSTMPVTCVGSHALSPVATGMCKCKGGKQCVKAPGKHSQCM